MKSFFLLAVLLLSTNIFCQELVVIDPVTKKTFNSERYASIKGSPFLLDEWITGRVLTAKGRSDTMGLKIDLFSNLVYLNKNDAAYEIEDNIKTVVLMPNVHDSTTYKYYKKGLSGNNLSPAQYVQVLLEGKISLYRSDIKLVSDLNEVNVGVVKTFSTYTRYFLSKDGTMQLIKLNKKDVMEAIKDKETQIESYMSLNKLSAKRESDLLLALKYYNTL